MSSLINKAKAAVANHKSNSSENDSSYQHDNPRSDNAGPHGSNMMNKVDPRVDSDRDGRNDPTSRTGGYGNTQTEQYGSGAGTGAGYGSTTGNTSGGYNDNSYGSNTQSGYGSNAQSGYDNPRSTNDGPHGSNMMNKVDPRVDSDRDNRNNPTSRVGGYGTQDQYGSTGTSGYGTSNTGAGAGGFNDSTYGSNTQSGYDNPRSTNEGPHGSNMMNKVDPRIDSDRDNRNNPSSRVGGYGTQDQQYGTSGAGDFNNSSQYTTPGSGNTSKTAGPHNSDMMNKLDPRVDSDVSGGKTYGGDKTYQ